MPEDGRIGLFRHIVSEFRERIRAQVERYLRDRNRGNLDWDRLPELVGTHAFDCNHFSTEAGKRLNLEGPPATWIRGGVSFKDEVIFSIPGTAHEWLYVPGAEGENRVLDFTIGYHLAARRRVPLAAALADLNPLLVESHSDFHYVAHYMTHWNQEQQVWGAQQRIDPPVRPW